jgi:NAD-dependent SIR2 family protein deacetylase
MATASDSKALVSQGATCTRCGGLMVSAFYADLDTQRATRCVQCGEMVDPMILHNRQLQQEEMVMSLFKSSEVADRRAVAA